MLRRSSALTALLLIAGPGFADPIEDTGYTAGCGEEGCFVESRGFTFFIPNAGSPPDLLAQLAALPPVSAVAFAGEMSNMGDSSADLALTRVTRLDDDLYEGNLQAMQGDWSPVGEETPFYISIIGLTWQEVVQDEPGDGFALAPGEACADGVVPGGMAINLYRFGDDPDADAGWQLEYIDGPTMVLRDFMGDQGQVEFARVTP